MLKNSFLILFFLSLCGCASLFKKGSMDMKGSLSKSNVDRQKKMKKPIAVIDTNKGALVFRLFPQYAPKTVKNFVSLAESKFYDGLVFHRVIKDFVIQGGDPKGDGSGGPGYTLSDEITAKLKHDKIGVLAMANRGPDTAGSQFYVTLASTPWLDGGYTIFGQLIRGEETLKAIGSVETDHNNHPLKEVVIRHISLRS